MPLAPEARALLDWLVQANLPRYPSIGPVESRKVFRERGPFLQPPRPEVASVSERAIPGPHGPIPARIYRPLGSASDAVLPVTVFFHGGGWVIGDLESYETLCRGLCNEARCCVVSVDYRLAPEHKFPAAVDDCAAATAWVAKQSAELKVDPGKIAVAGDSAGGNLAAVVAILARDAGAPRIAFQLLIYPGISHDSNSPSRRELGTGDLLDEELMQWFGACYVRGPEDYLDWRCAPIRAPDLSRLPPALVITAEYDPLRDEGKAYADRLRAAGVDVTYSCYPGMIHGFVSMGRVIPAAAEGLHESAQALAAAFAR
jgi:acetyl esterase